MYFESATINGELVYPLRLGKHEFPNEENLEIICRLAGFPRKPIDLHSKNMIEDVNNNLLFTDFETSAEFDFSWIDNGIYSISSISDALYIDIILKKKYEEYKEQKSNSNNKEKVLEILSEAMEGAVKACPTKAKEITELFRDYSKGELLQQLVDQGMGPKDPKPAFKGLIEKCKAIKESATVVKQKDTADTEIKAVSTTRIDQVRSPAIDLLEVESVRSTCEGINKEVKMAVRFEVSEIEAALEKRKTRSGKKE